MSKEALIAALRGKPAPFLVGGTTVHLRPMSHATRSEIVAWHAAHKDDPDAGLQLQRKTVAAVLTDETGEAAFTEAEVGGFGTQAVALIADEVAERAGLKVDKATDAGKGPSPT